MATTLTAPDAKPAFIGNIYGPLAPIAVLEEAEMMADRNLPVRLGFVSAFPTFNQELWRYVSSGQSDHPTS